MMQSSEENNMLTDLEKQKIVADYVENKNISETARINGVSRTSVRNIVKDNPEIADLFQRKKEANSLEMLEYMNESKKKAQDIIDFFLDALMKPEFLAKANVQHIAVAMGIIIDKFCFNLERAGNENKRLELQIMKLENELKVNDVQPVDDGLIQALNATGATVWEDEEA
jgi:hypothetical protein